MGAFILVGYFVLMAFAYVAALLASLLLFACLDAFVNRKQPVSLRQKITRKYRTGAWHRRALRLFVRVALAPAFLLIASWSIVPVFVSATFHPSVAAVVGVTAPKSVNILNSGETGTLDTVYWIHFTVDPQDTARLIPKGETASLSTVKQMDFHDLNPPEWWRPEDSGGTWRRYEKDSVNPDEHLCLLVNAQGNDVYAYRSAAFN